MNKIPAGVEMMIKSVVKMLGINPDLLFASVEQIDKSLHSVADDMATIRRQNSAIMAHLGISEPVKSDFGEVSNNDGHGFAAERRAGAGQA